MVITAQDTKLKPGYKQTEVGMVPEDWNVRTLGQLGEFKNGINKGKTDFGHGFPFVNLLDVFGVIKVSNDSGFGLVNSTDTERKVYSLKKGDVLFVRSSVKPEGVGLTTLVAEDLRDTVYSGFLIRFRDKGELAFEFKEHCFGQFGFRNRLIANSTISANTNINQNALKNLQTAFPPSKEEQRAIATALSDVDALITSLDRLIAKKRDIKQAVMQQLLSGKTRLPGFSGEWEMMKLGERCEFYSGGTPSTSNSSFYGGRISWITSSDLNIGRIKEVEGRITKQGFEKSSAKMVKKGTLLLALYGATAGVAAITEIDAAINQAVLAIIPQKDNSEFLFQKLTLLKDWLIKTYTQGGQPNLSGQIVKLIEFSLPPKPEQHAIATVLSDMDAEIAALEQKRDKTRALKQGMMQELLTGKTRLV